MSFKVNPFTGLLDRTLKRSHEIFIDQISKQEITFILYENHLSTTTTGSIETQAGVTILRDTFAGVDVVISKQNSIGYPTFQDVTDSSSAVVAANFNPSDTPPDWILSSSPTDNYCIIFAVRGRYDVLSQYLQDYPQYQIVEESVAGGGSGPSTPSVFTQDLTVAGIGTEGGITDGDTFTTGTSLEDFIRAFARKATVVYNAPTLALTATTGTREIGSSLNQALTATFNQRDAGSLTEIRIERNGSVINTQTTSPASFNDNSYLVQAGNQTWRAFADYTQGPIKNNNLGDPDPTGRIQAGTISSPSRIITGQYRYFFGSMTSEPTTSAAVRGLAQSSFSKNFTLNIGASDRYIVIAYPATLSNLQNNDVLYVQGLNSPVGNLFNQNLFDVNDAGGNPVPYKVYVQELGAPYGAASTYTVTLP